MPGSRSRVGLPKRHVAGDILVSGSGPFRYWRSALWNASESVPLGPVLPVISVSLILRPLRPGSWREGGMPMTCDGGRPS